MIKIEFSNEELALIEKVLVNKIEALDRILDDVDVFTKVYKRSYMYRCGCISIYNKILNERIKTHGQKNGKN